MATREIPWEEAEGGHLAPVRAPTWSAGRLPRWLVATVCVAIYGVVLFGAGVAAASIAVFVPGIPGIVLLFTVGAALLGVAPEIASVLSNAVLDATDPRRGT